MGPRDCAPIAPPLIRACFNSTTQVGHNIRTRAPGHDYRHLLSQESGKIYLIFN